jgi:hypothetical protein
MMSEVLERFRYRFQLWRREQGEDLFSSAPHEVKIYNKNESIPRIAIRHIFTWLMGVGIATGIGRIFVIYFPRIAFGMSLAVLALLVLWTFAAITVFIGEWRAKKAASAGESNII